MRNSFIALIASGLLCATPALAADDLAGATAAIDTACAGVEHQTEIPQRQLAEALLVSAGLLPSQLLRLVATTSLGPTGPDALADAALAFVREPDAIGKPIADRVRVLDTILTDHLAQRGGTLTAKLVVVGAVPDQSVFEPGLRLICPGKTPVTEIAGSLPPPEERSSGNKLGASRFAVRQKVDDFAQAAKDASGSFQGSYNRQRTTDLEGASTTTTTLSIRGAAGIRLLGDAESSWLFGYGDYALNHVRKRTAPIPTSSANDGRAKDIDVLEFGLTGSVPIGNDRFLLRLTGRAGTILDFNSDSRRLVAGVRVVPILTRTIGSDSKALCNFGSYSSNILGLPLEGRCTVAARVDVAEVLKAGTAMFTDADEHVAIGGDLGWEFRPSLLGDGKPRDGLVGGVVYRYQRMIAGRAPDIDRIDASLKYRWWLSDLAVDLGLSYSDGTEPKSLVDENKIAISLGLTY